MGVISELSFVTLYCSHPSILHAPMCLSRADTELIQPCIVSLEPTSAKVHNMAGGSGSHKMKHVAHQCATLISGQAHFYIKADAALSSTFNVSLFHYATDSVSGPEENQEQSATLNLIKKRFIY